jgi:ribosomal protein S18 acetylase RimI-like enzyme
MIFIKKIYNFIKYKYIPITNEICDNDISIIILNMCELRKYKNDKNPIYTSYIKLCKKNINLECNFEVISKQNILVQNTLLNILCIYNNNVIGMAHYYKIIDRNIIYLTGLYIDKKYRYLDIGSKMMNFINQIYYKKSYTWLHNNFTYIFLEVLEDDKISIQFYKNFGYNPIGRINKNDNIILFMSKKL